MATSNSNAVSSETEHKSVLSGFADYLYSRRGMAHATVGNNVGVVRRALPFFGPNPTHEEIDIYVSLLRQGGYSYAHIYNTTSSLENYMAFLGNPIKLGRGVKPKPIVIGVLSEAEVAILINAGINLRERTILSVLAYSGMRNEELCGIKLRDVDMATQTIRVEKAKRQALRNVCVSGSCMELLTRYMKERGGELDDFLFQTQRRRLPVEPQDIRKLIRRAAKRAGIKKRIYPHLLRHSLATNMLHRGASLMAIKEQLGHAYIESTMLYIHASVERLQADYRQYMPSYL